MNKNNLQKIFNNYIEKFDFITYDHEEIYKWEIINDFKALMDKALTVSDEEFPVKLNEAKKLTENLIDSYTTPFYGLVKFSEKEPETVRKMFLDLYSADDGDLKKRQNNIQAFLRKSHELRDKYYPGSYMYKDDMHSVTGYLFLYDPDHNYMYKATQSLAFADSIEYYDDWGYGDSLKLDIYYKMCDMLVDEMKSDEGLLAIDSSRFNGEIRNIPKVLYPDSEKHILAFDIIYSCSVYGLFDGINFERPKSKERQILKEKKEKATLLFEKLQKAKAEQDKLSEALDYINSVFVKGSELNHKSLGKGIIKETTDTTITVEFTDSGIKKLGTVLSAVNGIISVDTDDYKDNINKYRALLKNESNIKNAYNRAEREMAEYSDYLE